MDVEKILSRLVQIGTVTDVSGTKCRVKFHSTNMTSGWLRVIQRLGGAVEVAPDNQHSHVIHDTYSGGGSSVAVAAHNHTGTLTRGWMPKINDTVLVLYLPAEQGDGYVLGGI